MKIVYSPNYYVDLKGHVFPTVKYKLVRDSLLSEGIIKDSDIIEPTAALDEDVLLVHTQDYVSKLKTGTLSPLEILTLELPYLKELVTASWICAGGSILAAQIALEEKICVHLGGGFHHAFPDHGEGFCVLNDIAIAIRHLKKKGMIKKALVIDCDLHHGNGTAYIFKDDEDVFTFSMHQANNYPLIKPPSNMDINLDDGTDDATYLRHLRNNIPKIVKEFRPQFLMFVAGADPYKNDQLGGLNLTIEGLKKRDELVFEVAKINSIPICVVLAGGYAFDVKDTVRIHANTVISAIKISWK